MAGFLGNRFRKREGRSAAVKTNGFASKLENAVHEMLKVRQAAGELSDIKCQQSFKLQDGDRTVRVTWKIDFSAVEVKSGKTIYFEAKGFEESVYKLKLKMWRKHKYATLEIWKGSWQRPFLAERIEGA